MSKRLKPEKVAALFKQRGVLPLAGNLWTAWSGNVWACCGLGVICTQKLGRRTTKVVPNAKLPFLNDIIVSMSKSKRMSEEYLCGFYRGFDDYGIAAGMDYTDEFIRGYADGQETHALALQDITDDDPRYKLMPVFNGLGRVESGQ